jgi:hypothetical protein
MGCSPCGCFEWVWTCDESMGCAMTGAWSPGEDNCGTSGGFPCSTPPQPSSTPSTNDTRVWVCCDEP